MFKNTKRVFALMLAVAVVAMSMFTGVVASAKCGGTVDLLEFGDYLIEQGSTNKYYDNKLADNGETGDSWENAIIIDSAEEFVYLAKASGNDTIGKYYKVADGIDAFDLSKGNLDFTKGLADNLDAIKGSGKNHSGGTPGFQGHFDGNGVTVYGAWTNDTVTAEGKDNTPSYAGLFGCTYGTVTIKNVNVRLSYFSAKVAAGGIVGYYKGEGTGSLTVENCSVADCYIKTVGTGYGAGVGSIVGYAHNYSSAGNGPITVNNCFVNLDEEYFISQNEIGVQTDASLDGVHGGLVGFAVSNYSNDYAGNITNCVSLGVKPYTTTTCTANNNVQHSATAHHFANVYTDQAAGSAVSVGGTSNLGEINYTGKIFELTADQMKGAAAVDNMNLDWSVWMADDEGYPELRVSHKAISVVDNKNGTHSEVCECGFGGIAVDHSFVDGECACGADLNCAARKTVYWNGSATAITTGSGTKDDPYIIKSAEEFAWLVQNTKDAASSAGNPIITGKYYKIDDAIGAIVLQSKEYAEDIMKLNSAAAVKEYFETNAANMKTWYFTGWEQSCFNANFDGNGVTVYGLYQVSTNNAGLFSTVDGGASIKNIALKNSYLVSNAGNYQVGGIAAVTAANSYGAKTNGAIWFDGCVVANNYLYNSSDSHDRSGVIIGASSDIVYIDNCLVYGNDATYGDGVKMPVWSSANNSVIVSGDIVKPDGLELVDDGAETARYYNKIRNSIIFGAYPYDTAQGVGSRFNDPKCFENVLTDADPAVDTFPGKDGPVYMTVAEEQLKTVAVEDLATLDLGDNWVKTDSYPELKAFHDDVFVAVDNGDGTHSTACSCGKGSGTATAHNYVDGACDVCGADCQHTNTYDAVEEKRVEPTCTATGSYESVVYCKDCDGVASRETVTIDALGHTEKTKEVVTLEPTCSAAGSKDVITYCDVCDEEIGKESVAIEINPDNHDFGDDDICDLCSFERDPYIPGDVNDDKIVNNKDLAVLMQKLNGWNVTISDKAADVTGDEIVNNKDYALLMQYVNGWNVELK